MARKQFLLRIDPELWQELEKWAADDLRSVNAQIEWLLRDAVRQRRGSGLGQTRPGRAAEGDHEDDQASAAGGPSEERGDNGEVVAVADHRSTVRGGRF
jgi:hypothetical protein